MNTGRVKKDGIQYFEEDETLYAFQPYSNDHRDNIYSFSANPLII